MDLLAKKTPAETDAAVARMLERARTLEVDTIYLKAFSDIRTGDQADKVYFPNRVLPVEKDLLAGIARAIRAEGFAVHVCVPVLGIRIPAVHLKPDLKVMESSLGNIRATMTKPSRLSPFSPEALDLLRGIYADLASHVTFDGIVFLEDAFLTEEEDFNPNGIAFLRDLGTTEINPKLLSAGEKARWTKIKTRQIERFIAALIEVVRDYRPNAVFSRVLYAPALHSPADSEAWLAQRFETTVRACDRVIVLADPEAENVEDADAWLRALVGAAAAFPRGLEKTVFQLNAYDNFRNRWMPERTLIPRVQALVESGARHIIYSPDDYDAERPRLKALSAVFALDKEHTP
jgi:biofilm PGA synthesis lipoprotein PgaB